MQGVEEPGPEGDWVSPAVDGEPLLAGLHHNLHELVRAHLCKRQRSLRKLMTLQTRTKPGRAGSLCEIVNNKGQLNISCINFCFPG